METQIKVPANRDDLKWLQSEANEIRRLRAKTEDAGTYVDRLTAKLPPPNPAMQLTGPWGGNFGVLATAPARGLSLSR